MADAVKITKSISCLFLETASAIAHNHGINLWFMAIAIKELLSDGGNERFIQFILDKIYCATTKSAAHDA